MKTTQGIIVFSTALAFAGLAPAKAQAFTNAFVLVQAVHDPALDVGPEIFTTFQNSADLPFSLGFGVAPNLALPAVGPKFSVIGSVTGNHGGTVSAFAAGADGYVHGPVGVSGSGGQAQSQAILTYTFQLVGPAASSPIDVELIADGSATSAGAGGASVALVLDTDVLGSARVQFGDSQSFHFDQTLPFFANQTYTMKMTAVAAASDFAIVPGDPREHLDGGAGHAFVDPQFILPPEFAATYHFVGIPSAVPLPASLWLLGPALGGLGLVRRRLA